MRMLKTLALAAVVLAFAAAPALAACGSAYRISSAETFEAISWVWTEGWNVYYYYPGVPPVDYLTATPPITPEFAAVYWQLGAGNTVLGIGNDSGSFAVPPATWVYFDPLYAGYWPDAALVRATWAQSPDIDGCPTASNYCACVLLQDQKDGVGYFAMVSGAGVNYDVFINQGGSDPIGWNVPIVLKPMPAPAITRIDMNMDTHNLTFNVGVADPVAGMYQLDGCDCGPIGYVIYEQRVTQGDLAPGDRNAAAGWTAKTGVTPIGTPAVYESDCGAGTGGLNYDVYLAAGLVFDSSFPGGPYKVILSENAGPTACGPTLAEPQPLQPRIRRQLRDIPRAERTR